MNYNPCETCKGGLRCMNPYSECYGYYCGEFPGTGYIKKETKEEEKGNNGNE